MYLRQIWGHHGLASIPETASRSVRVEPVPFREGLVGQHGQKSDVAAGVLPGPGLRGDVLHLPFLLPGAGLLQG